MPVRPVMPSDAPDYRSDESSDYQLELYRRMRQGDARAREMLIFYQVPWAITLANVYMSRLASVHIGVTRDDIDQVAYLGIIQAVDDWDPNRGALTSVSKVYIVREVSAFLRTTARRRPISQEIQNRLVQIHEVAAEYAHEHGANPSIGWIAQRLELTEEQVIKALRTQRVLGCSEELLGQMSTSLGQPEVELFRSKYFREYARARIHQLLGELPGTRQEAVRLRFGLDEDGEPHTLEQVALAMHTSPQAAQQKIKKSLDYLRAHYADELLEIKEALAA